MITILTFHAITACETMSEGGHCVCCIQDDNKDRGSLFKPVLCQSGGKCTFPSSPYIPCKAMVFLILLIVKRRAVMNSRVRRMVMTHDNGEIVPTHGVISDEKHTNCAHRTCKDIMFCPLNWCNMYSQGLYLSALGLCMNMRVVLPLFVCKYFLCHRQIAFFPLLD